jgi:GAF domain-containing protein
VSGFAPGSWLGIALTALDQRELGAIQVLAASDQAFSEVDEAVLAHLAQMVSAAVERAQLYAEAGP